MDFRWRSVSWSVWWERAVTAFFDAIRLRSIQNKILVFALLATLIPLIVGWDAAMGPANAADSSRPPSVPAITGNRSSKARSTSAF